VVAVVDERDEARIGAPSEDRGDPAARNVTGLVVGKRYATHDRRMSSAIPALNASASPTIRTGSVTTRLVTAVTIARRAQAEASSTAADAMAARAPKGEDPGPVARLSPLDPPPRPALRESGSGTPPPAGQGQRLRRGGPGSPPGGVGHPIRTGRQAPGPFMGAHRIGRPSC
jgi:hypothetical protein